MKTIARKVFVAEGRRVVTSLDIVDRKYVVHIRSESVKPTENGYDIVSHVVHEDLSRAITLYTMREGERQTRRLDNEMTEEYVELIELFSDVIQDALRNPEVN